MKATYEDHMGSDLSVVNAAKVSFGKRSEWENEEDSWVAPFIPEYLTTGEVRVEMRNPDFVGVLSKQDQRLIQFLARGCTSGDWEDMKRSISGYEIDYKADAPEIESLFNHIRRMPNHWSPFAHTAITLHLKMPIFVARQIMKHTTGIEYNEVSRRYVDSEPEFYVPDVWRKKADNVKQGSSDEAVESMVFGSSECHPKEGYGTLLDYVAASYQDMLESGVAPEQARMVLPQSMYTEVIATGNLYAWANLYIQRTDSHAQKETQDLAKQIGEIIQPLYPVSWEALTA